MKKRFHKFLNKELKNKEFAIEYLKDSLEESDEEFIISLKKCISIYTEKINKGKLK